MTTATLQAHHLYIRATAKDPVALRESMGSSLRGAFVEALWGRFCMNKEAPTCKSCPLMESCPVSSLVEPLYEERPRIRDVPRPFAIRPPAHHSLRLAPGDSFTFGLTIFGRRLELFPYIAIALQIMGEAGIGQRVEDNGWQRGRFLVEEVKAVNALTGTGQVVQVAGNARFTFPNQPTTWADAETCAASMPADRVTLHLLTPLRLKAENQIVRQPLFLPLIERLLERHDFLAQAYAGTPFEQEERMKLIALAESIEIAHDETRWTTVRSYSCRQKKAMFISGLTGKVTYRGDLRALLPLLVWGTVIQAGKNTTKGDGVYDIVAATPSTHVLQEDKSEQVNASEPEGEGTEGFRHSGRARIEGTAL